jgi:hypothetical protein
VTNRRDFLKAGLGCVVACAVPAVATAAPCPGVLEVYSAGGTMLVSVPLRIEGEQLVGSAEVDASGVPAYYQFHPESLSRPARRGTAGLMSGEIMFDTVLSLSGTVHIGLPVEFAA